MRSNRAALLVLATVASGCFGEVPWGNHISPRSYGRAVKIAHVDPDETIVGRVSRNMHYVSIALDSVFFRDLPGMTGRSVVFGFEIGGAGKKRVKTVLDAIESVGPHSFLAIDNAVVLQPFLYTGQNMDITLWFKATSKDNLANIKGRLSGAGDALKKLNPISDEVVNLANNIFEGVIGAFVQKEQSFKYMFTLYPADSTYRDKPELLFTAGRHILIATPPATAPSPFKEFKPSGLTAHLGLRGNRLIWLHNEEEFTELPYIILNITRYKRYPNPDTSLRKGIAAADRAYEQGNLDLARAHIKTIGGLIVEDKVITQRERNLEQLWQEFRTARVDAAKAEREGARDKQLIQILAQVRHLGEILTGFDQILEPFETKDIDYKMSRLVAHYERIAQAEGKPTEELTKLLEAKKGAMERTKKAARDEETARHKLLAKHVDAKQKPKPPPLAMIQAQKELRGAAQPFYKKWWFWTVTGAVILGGGSAATYVLTKPTANQVTTSTTLGGVPGTP